MSGLKFRAIQKYAIVPIIIVITACCGNSTNEYTSAVQFGELSSLAKGKTDKAMDAHGFTEIYEHIFHPLKNKSIKILEIGIGKGGSLALWQEYFPDANIYGIDINDRSHLNSARIHTFVADQADRDQLKSFISKYGGGFDIIIDDGGHKMEQQQISLGCLFTYVKQGGYYIIEDVHTSFPDLYVDFGVEEDEKNTTFQMLKNFIRNATIDSQYLTPDENDYLTKHIEYCNLSFRNNRHQSTVCIFKKRE